jgi:hypothetical protein
VFVLIHFVLSESYGGHYVPNTAKKVQEGGIIDLKGFAVGNGYTDWQLDFNANVENGRFHALTSPEYFASADAACDGDFARCFWPRDDVTCPKDCDDAVSLATQEAMNGAIDIYDIYEDVCLDTKQPEMRDTQVLYTVHCTLYPMHCTNDARHTGTVHCALYPMHCTNDA